MLRVDMIILLAFWTCAHAQNAEKIDDALMENLCFELFDWVLKASPGFKHIKNVADKYTTFEKSSFDSAIGIIDLPRPLLRPQIRRNQRPKRNALPFLKQPLCKRENVACRASSLAPLESEPQQKQSQRRYTDWDWLKAMTTVSKSIVLTRIASHLMFNVFITTFVLLAQDLGYSYDFSTLPHSLLGGFLGLLLVFRTNAAYARFWEARVTWGNINNDCREMSVKVTGFVQPIAPAAAEQLVDALADFPATVRDLCDGVSDSSQEPIRVCYRMHDALARATKEGEEYFGNLTDMPHRLSARLFAFQLSRIHQRINSLCDHAGACARIANTPVPLSYSRHASRFLTIWCGTLPFVIAPKMGYLAYPVTIIACWMLFGIEELGHLIEQPFAKDAAKYDISIPIEDIAKDIKAAIRYLTNASLTNTSV